MLHRAKAISQDRPTHERGRLLRREERCPDVEAKGAVEMPLAHLAKRREFRQAGVNDQNVDPTRLVADNPEHLGDVSEA